MRVVTAYRPVERTLAKTAGTLANSCVATNARESRVTVSPTGQPPAFPRITTVRPAWTLEGVSVIVGRAALANPVAAKTRARRETRRSETLVIGAWRWNGARNLDGSWAPLERSPTLEPFCGSYFPPAVTFTTAVTFPRRNVFVTPPEGLPTPRPPLK